jgi:hypothetical protein
MVVIFVMNDEKEPGANSLFGNYMKITELQTRETTWRIKIVLFVLYIFILFYGLFARIHQSITTASLIRSRALWTGVQLKHSWLTVILEMLLVEIFSQIQRNKRNSIIM